jgi:hypothetical protein
VDRHPDPDGGYWCGRCAECLAKGWTFNLRWATKTEQSRNQGRNHRLTIDGLTLCLAEWAERSGTAYHVIRKRLKLGWDARAAVFTEVAA